MRVALMADGMERWCAGDASWATVRESSVVDEMEG